MKPFNIDLLYQKLALLTPKLNFVIAYSGGLDSHVLLYSLAKLAKQNSAINLRAVHIHHGLSPHANAWAEHCTRICQELQIVCEMISVNATDVNKSPEEAARDARYAALASMLKDEEVLLTAHNCNDQAETLLLQLMRGAGPKGLAGMPSKIAFGPSFLIRPLLDFSRAQLQAYAVQHHLKWIEDESNFNSQFDRNYLRHEVLPILQKRWPSLLQTFSRSALHCAEAADLLDDLADQDWQAVKGADVHTLNIIELQKLSEIRQRNLLRYWLRYLDLPLPSSIKLKQLLRDVLHCRYDAKPKISWPGAEVRRFRNFIYAMPSLSMQDVNVRLTWDLKAPLQLPNDLGILEAQQKQGEGLCIKNLNGVTVGFRTGGEILHPVGRQGSHALKKLFQEWQVPVWLRDRVPLIFVGDDLAAVTGYAVDAKYAAGGLEMGFVISLL